MVAVRPNHLVLLLPRPKTPPPVSAQPGIQLFGLVPHLGRFDCAVTQIHSHQTADLHQWENLPQVSRFGAAHGCVGMS